MDREASRARLAIARRTAKGDEESTAFRETTEQAGAETGEHNGRVYASFPDHSYLRMAESRNVQVITDNAGRFTAWKTINGIHAACSACGEELWCDSAGKPSENLRLLSYQAGT